MDSISANTSRPGFDRTEQEQHRRKSVDLSPCTQTRDCHQDRAALPSCPGTEDRSGRLFSPMGLSCSALKISYRCDSTGQVNGVRPVDVRLLQQSGC